MEKAPKRQKTLIRWRLFIHWLWIGVMALYWALADYGRNFVVHMPFFYCRYRGVLAPLMHEAGPVNADKYNHAIWMLAFGNTVPFVGPLTIDVEIKKFLFCPGFGHCLPMLAHLDILKPICSWDITFWDWCLFSDATMEALERQIHAIVCPGVEFIWQDDCANSPDEVKSHRKWCNRKCDVLAMWSHIHGKRDVFVTSDKDDFRAASKKPALIALGANDIQYPPDAVSLI